MTIEESYETVYEHISTIVSNQRAKKQYTALGLSSNLDLICDIDAKRINQLLHRHLPLANIHTILPPKIITSIEEFLQCVIFFFSRGIGGEVPISDIRILENIGSTYHSLGGTAVQGAAALAAVGFSSIVHLTDDSSEVCNLLNSPYISTVDCEGELIHASEVHQQREKEIHLIIQFKEGEVIESQPQYFTIPESNRLIITQVSINQTIPLHKPYFAYIEEHASQISSNVISSFNEIVEPHIMQNRLAFIKEHIQRYKTNNKRSLVFYEDAHFHEKMLQELILNTLYPYIDIVSENQEELAYILRMNGVIINFDDILSCVSGMRYIQKKYSIKKGIILHTKDYSMYVGEKIGYDITQGLMLGNLLATTKALFGFYGSFCHIEEVLSLPMSIKGLEHKGAIDSHSWQDEVILVPTKYIENPTCTIGLGDSFVAGVQMCFNGEEIIL